MTVNEGTGSLVMGRPVKVCVWGGELVHMRLKTIIILKASCWGQRQNKNHETNVTGKAAVPLLQCWRLSKWDIRSSGL